MTTDTGAEVEHYDGFQEGRDVTTANLTYINESGLPDELIIPNMRENQEIASQIEQWSQSLSGAASSRQSIDVFNRNKWSGKGHMFAQMSQAAWAVENDDILSTLADVTEGLAFSKCRFELNDDDEEDIWNQWAGDVDLDSRLREMFRESFKVSQFYVGLWWEQKVYSVRDNLVAQKIADMKRQAAEDKQAELEAAGPQVDPLTGVTIPVPPPPVLPSAKGNRRRKKKYPLEIPTAMTIFDPTKILPVGTLLFGRERFAYIASDGEHEAFQSAMKGEVVDPTVMQLVDRHYEPNGGDKAACADLGVDDTRLWLLKEDAVFRHTLTKSQYERFSVVRMSSVFPILELKSHLRSSDRATLIGNTNFIVVITKGTDKLPAKAAEIENLREQSRIIARLPVIVGDHRLEVKIVSPSLDNTLMETRWQVLDSRLVFRALATFSPVVQGGNSSGAGVSEMSRVVARGIESRRHMMMRTLERAVFNKVMARNEGVLKEGPSLSFTPRRVTLDFSAEVMAAILKVRDRGDISRETMLEELDYDQDVEVLRRVREALTYDDTFNSSVPHSSPGANPVGAPGATPPPTPPKPAGDLGRPPGVQETAPRAPAKPAGS